VLFVELDHRAKLARSLERSLGKVEWADGGGTVRVVLDPVGALRHVAVGGSLLAGPALVLAGLLGGGNFPERFDAKQVLVTPAGGDGVRIRETIDQDFGTNDRHGHERIIPNDFGVPTDIDASSPDAPAQIDAIDYGFETRIRLGDPDVTIDGQHRYVLAYTLPSARISSGELALDIIANDEAVETGRFEVVVSGFELVDPLCNVGASKATRVAAPSSAMATSTERSSSRWHPATASPSAAPSSASPIRPMCQCPR
jgi:hypothetical protein